MIDYQGGLTLVQKLQRMQIGAWFAEGLIKHSFKKYYRYVY